MTADEAIIQEEGERRARKILEQAKIVKETSLSLIVKKK